MGHGRFLVSTRSAGVKVLVLESENDDYSQPCSPQIFINWVIRLRLNRNQIEEHGFDWRPKSGLILFFFQIHLWTCIWEDLVLHSRHVSNQSYGRSYLISDSVSPQSQRNQNIVIITKINVDIGMDDKPCVSYWDKPMYNEWKSRSFFPLKRLNFQYCGTVGI